MKPKFPKPAKQFEIPLYGGTVMLFKTPKAFEQAVAYLKVPRDEELVLAGTFMPLENDEGEALFLIGWFDGNRSTLVHEAGHLAIFVCKRVGIDPNDSAGEAFCYLLGDLTMQLGIDRK